MPNIIKISCYSIFVEYYDDEYLKRRIMDTIYCEYDEKKRHKHCKNFPCALCDVGDEKKILKKLYEKIGGIK